MAQPATPAASPAPAAPVAGSIAASAGAPDPVKKGAPLAQPVKPVQPQAVEGPPGSSPEGAVEGQETPPEGTEAPADSASEVADPDLAPHTVGEETVTLKDLKDGWAYLQTVAAEREQVQTLKQNLSETFKALGTDPGPVLLDIFAAARGNDRGKAYQALVEMATGIVNDYVTWENMTQAERDAARYKAENDDIRRRQADDEKKRQADETSAAEAAAFTKWQSSFKEAATAAGVPYTPSVEEALSDIIIRGLEIGRKLTAAEAVAKYKVKREADRKAALADLAPGDIPEPTLAAMRQGKIDAVKAGRSAPTPEGDSPRSRVVKMPKRPESSYY